MDKDILRLNNISKSFGTVNVLDDINLSVKEGSVHSLLGENGAGKSTLCRIIAGIYAPDSGSIVFDDNEHEALNLDQAQEIGISMVHQELQVLPKMTIADNLFVGNEINKGLFVDKKKTHERTGELLKKVGLNLSPDTYVRDVDIAGRQLIEIARAISVNARLVILDEPTSSLSTSEIEKLFGIVNEIKKTGVSFIFISHRLNEIFEISDEISILKDGKMVATLTPETTDEDEIVRLMVGRNYDDYYHRKRLHFGKEVLRVENMTGIPPKTDEVVNAYRPQNISFSLNEGEILGIAGLVGAGRTELIRLLFGRDKKQHGTVYIDNEQAKIENSADAIKYGMGWVTEDRKTEGLVLKFNIVQNMVMVVQDRLKKGIFIDKKRERSLTEEYVEKLNVRTTGILQELQYLSGGNQQKVVVAKWLASRPKILVMDEPTRGIDVGAKAEIYKLMNELTSEGLAILLISSELPEIIGMSDRILVMYEGKITGEFQRDEFSEEAIMECAIGGKNGGRA